MSGDYFSEFKLDQGSLDADSWCISPPDQIINTGWLCAKSFMKDLAQSQPVLMIWSGGDMHQLSASRLPWSSLNSLK